MSLNRLGRSAALKRLASAVQLRPSRDPKVTSVMAYVGTALLNAIKTTDMEERIAALERSRQRDGSLRTES